jgi:DNA-binding Xre family transcriptional regulator
LTDKDGYGVFFYEGKQYRAPPFALKLDGRPVPKGMMACHTCDNPICVRLDHLYPGTPKQNVDDMISRGRANHGKKLTAEQVSKIKKLDLDHGEIAAAFGVSRSNISLIKEGKIWRHVP